MKYAFLLLPALLIICSPAVFGQGVSVNNTGAAPDPSAMIDISSTLKGTLITRMNTAQMKAINSPANGLIIYNTDCGVIDYYNGGGWVALGNSGNLSTPGSVNGTTNPCQNATNISYSIGAVPGATGYSWTAPSDAVIATGQGTNAITVNFGVANGNVCVWASNPCGTSNPSCTAITLLSPPQSAPTASGNTPSQTQIVWNWNSVSGATGYKWNTINDYSSATDLGNSTSYTQTSLTCNTGYTLYVWAYNACGNSSAVTLTQTTTSCCSPVVTLDAASEVTTSNTTNTFTINTTNANEIILVAVNSCPASQGSFTGTVTVDAYSLTVVNTVNVSQSEMVLYGCVATTSGSHTITINWGNFYRTDYGQLGAAYAASYTGFCNIPTVAGNVQSVEVGAGCNSSISESVTPAAANSCLFGDFSENTYTNNTGTVTWTNDNLIRTDHNGDGMDYSIANTQLSGTSQVTVTAADNESNNACNINLILTVIHP